MKLFEPRLNPTVLRTMAGFRGSHDSIFLLYLAGNLISIHKEFEYKNKILKKNFVREKENKEPSW